MSKTSRRWFRTDEFSLPAPETGKPLFDANCGVCHRDYNSLAMNLRNKTWMDIGADIWNHSQKMPTVRMVGPDDMRKILAYVWQLQYDGPPGNRVLGQKAFVEKRCVECHQGPIKEANALRLFPSWRPHGARHDRRITGCWNRGFPGPTFLPPTFRIWSPT